MKARSVRIALVFSTIATCGCAPANERVFREEPRVVDDNVRIAYADEQDEMYWSGAPFDRAAIRIGFRNAMLAAESCSPTGLAKDGSIRLTLQSSGEATDIEITPSQSDPLAIECMRTALARIRVKPFTWGPLHLVRRFSDLDDRPIRLSLPI